MTIMTHEPMLHRYFHYILSKYPLSLSIASCTYNNRNLMNSREFFFSCNYFTILRHTDIETLTQKN